MSSSSPPESPLVERVTKAVGNAASAFSSSQPPSGDLLDMLKQEEVRVLGEHWPKGKPTGDGDDYYESMMQIRVRRLRWKSRMETGGEIAWLVGKLAGVAICFTIAWEHLPN